MTFSTAFKVSGVFLLALGAELLAAYFLFSNYAYDLANTGEYTVEEAYTTGPIGSAATMFYLLFGVTAAAALVPPVIAAASFAFGRRDAQAPSVNQSLRVLPPPHPDHSDISR
ncbi:MAG: hypothetical protein ACOYXR_04100 [Nitrospirota bacterium]